jgi:hypothetical protein
MNSQQQRPKEHAGHLPSLIECKGLGQPCSRRGRGGTLLTSQQQGIAQSAVPVVPYLALDICAVAAWWVTLFGKEVWPLVWVRVCV